MRSALATVLVASVAFIGTMYDNYFAFAAQLLVTDEKNVRKVSNAQAFGIAVVAVFAMGVGKGLGFLPLPVVGLACFAPWALALHSWRHRHDAIPETYKRGAVTTFLMTFALGGDNLAVWIPLFRANSVMHLVLDVCVFTVLEVLFILSAVRLAKHPKAIAWGTRSGRFIIPWVYVFLGFLILIECRTF